MPAETETREASVFNSHLLPLTLELAVPLEIHRLNSTGGPTDEDWNDARMFGAHELGPKGDQLLFKCKETASMFAKLAHAIAVLAFVPGGVKLFGRHWVAETITQPQEAS